jgi:glutaredoxin-like protein NrdH
LSSAAVKLHFMPPEHAHEQPSRLFRRILSSGQKKLNRLHPYGIVFLIALKEPGMPSAKPKIKLFTLSTCSHCNRTKRFLTENNVEMEYVDVDLLTGAERERIMDEVRKLNPDCSFPTICIDNTVIVGFNEEKLRKALGLK